MIGPGRTPKPTALKQLEGNPGKRPLNGGEVQPKALLRRPGHITDKVAEEWDRVVGAMPPGFYTEADVPVLAIYCEALVMRRNALADVQKDGRTIAGSTGQKAAHPMIGVASKQADIILKCAAHLGMSPAARARLNAPNEPQDEDEDEHLFTGRSH